MPDTEIESLRSQLSTEREAKEICAGNLQNMTARRDLLQSALDEARATITRLEAEAVELRKDRDRLTHLEDDWRENGDCPLTEFEGKFYCDGDTDNHLKGSLREAIDAAMTPAPAETKEKP